MMQRVMKIMIHIKKLKQQKNKTKSKDINEYI